jgi:hypothetical protein
MGIIIIRTLFHLILYDDDDDDDDDDDNRIKGNEIVVTFSLQEVYQKLILL